MKVRARVLGVVVVLGLVPLALTAVVVRPVQGPVGDVDVIVVLAGAEQTRLALGLELWRNGRAPALALSSVHAPETTALCRKPAAGVVCFLPSPISTRGEARVFGKLAREMGWRSALVVTSTTHLTRARMLVRRCFPGPVTAVSAGDSGTLAFRAGRLPREVAALALVQVDRRC